MNDQPSEFPSLTLEQAFPSDYPLLSVSEALEAIDSAKTREQLKRIRCNPATPDEAIRLNAAMTEAWEAIR